jgi:dihydrofolate synthase / folylpolyglutamate synthase
MSHAPQVKLQPDTSEPVVSPQVPKSARSKGFATYDEALAFVMDRVNVERTAPTAVDPHVFKLDRMKALLLALGEPHNSFRSVHVAGSKGKGSVCEMTAACLQGCGLATGLYTSPHLVDIRERIRLGKEMIPREDFRAAAEKVAQAIPPLRKAHGEPTFFEVITAIAFLYFAEQAVDVAVVEVGLGGRLDSTNVLRPVVCAITAIQLEHTDLLGNTLEQIAGEKAGIIKPGVPIVTIAQQKDSIESVFREIAAAQNAPMKVVGKDVDFSYRMEFCPELGQHARVCLNTPRSSFEHLPVPLKGEHQAVNLGLVLAILDELKGLGLRIGEREVSVGLATTKAAGRLELIHASPRIFVDGAHNPESIACLTKALGAHVKYDSLVVIFGCAKDKDIKGMLAKVASGADKVIFTKATGNARAAEPKDLQRKFAEVTDGASQVAPTVREALNLASRAVTSEDIICVTGSFYIAGEAKRLLAERYGDASRPAPAPVVVCQTKAHKPS